MPRIFPAQSPNPYIPREMSPNRAVWSPRQGTHPTVAAAPAPGSGRWPVGLRHRRRTVKSDLSGKSIAGIIGGPPCQGFSDIGRRDRNDARNFLFEPAPPRQPGRNGFERPAAQITRSVNRRSATRWNQTAGFFWRRTSPWPWTQILDAALATGGYQGARLRTTTIDGALLLDHPGGPSAAATTTLGPSYSGLVRQAVADLRGRHRSGAPPLVAGVRGFFTVRR